MQSPIGGPSTFVGPPKPPGFSFKDLLKEVGLKALESYTRPQAPQAPGPSAAPAGGFAADQSSTTATIDRPATPGAPVAAPPSSGMLGTISQVAAKLLGAPLSPASEMKLAMDLAGGAGPAEAVKSLVRTPEIAQGLAARAMSLVKSGKVSQFLKGGLKAKLIEAKDAFKSGGIMGALSSLKSMFNQPSVSKLPVGGAPAPAPAPASAPVPAAGAPAATKPLTPRTTVPERPEYKTCKLDVSDPEKAVVAAATWVRENFPETFEKYNKGVYNKDGTINKQAERRNGHELSTHVMGVLRANGLDVQRVVRHPDQEVGSPGRYVNDALTLPDGRNIDFYGGEDNTPQFHDLGFEARKLQVPE